MYTIELKTLMEGLTGRTTPCNYEDVAPMIDKAIPLIFDDFPIYQESHRLPLCRDILSAYLYREICDVPFGKWKWMFNHKLQEIMPYYNQLYATEDLKFNPLENVNYWRTLDSDQVGSDTTNVTDNLTVKDTLDKTRSGSGDKDSKTTDNETHTDHTLGNEKSQGSQTGNEKSDSNGESSYTQKEDTSGTSSTNGTSDSTSNTSKESSGEELIARSDTPMSQLEPLTELKYLSSAEHTTKSESGTTDVVDHTENESSGKTSGNKNGSGSDSSEAHSTGNFSTNSTGERGYEDNKNGNSDRHIAGHEDTSFTETGKDTRNRTDNRTTGSNKNTTTNRDDKEHIAGKQGTSTYMSMIKEFRENILNIDKMIVEEMGECFFLLYS